METNIFKQEQDAVIAAYSRRLLDHGCDVRALNWGSRVSQERRFEVILEAGIKSNMSVLDVGCGLGDFLPWSKSLDLEIEYNGLDVTADMVAVCQKRFPNCNFSAGDITTWKTSTENAYDFVFASGIFYDRPGSGHEYMKKAAQSMFRLCRLGIAFNTITSLADQSEANEFRPCIGDIADIGASISRRFVIRHDYHPCDATVYLYK